MSKIKWYTGVMTDNNTSTTDIDLTYTRNNKNESDKKNKNRTNGSKLLTEVEKGYSSKQDITEVKQKKRVLLRDNVVKPYKPRELNLRQKTFAKIRATEPRLKNYEVASKAGYGNDKTSLAVLSQQATELLKKPEVVLEMSKYSNEAESTVYKVMQLSVEQMYSDERRGVEWASQADKTANAILDRVHGKSKQTVDVTQKSVVLNIDLTSGD